MAATVEKINGFRTWEVTGSPLVVRCSESVLEEIRLVSEEQLSAIPRGGLEVGGVLFGSVESDTVTVTSHRELRCEYAFGPSYLLSESDTETLRELLEASNSTSDEPKAVGFYVSHTRRN